MRVPCRPLASRKVPAAGRMSSTTHVLCRHRLPRRRHIVSETDFARLLELCAAGRFQSFRGCVCCLRVSRGRRHALSRLASLLGPRLPVCPASLPGHRILRSTDTSHRKGYYPQLELPAGHSFISAPSNRTHLCACEGCPTARTVFGKGLSGMMEFAASVRTLSNRTACLPCVLA